jgi:uncharacterized membrane protein
MDRYIDLRPLEALTRWLSQVTWLYAAFGLLLISSGLLLLIWPELLVALVAALFFVAGATVLAQGWHVWRTRRRYQAMKRRILP